MSAVVVTYNRLSLLQECIDALRKQTRVPDEIIVVDNGSTDGTHDWLSKQPDIFVVRQQNSGSSGGQATGVIESYRRNHDWFWLMDDDTIPQPDALKRMCDTPQFRDKSAGFLASIVVWTDGRCQPLSAPLTPAHTWISKTATDHCIGAESSTFVSVMVNRLAIARVGVPFRGFFLLWDDIEFTTRISRFMPGYFVFDSFAVHKTPDFDAPALSNSPLKMRHHQRNRVLYLRMQPMSPRRRWWKILKLVVRDVGLLASRRITFQDFTWTLRGIFMNCDIEFVTP
ncbi:MAG: glycosyltransferase family 2 protein [Planctomycetales bacterium]|nr:glycosyltransferase family 2 protein [Planctomycetales bacterium]MBN8628066.1 glycosyltransferase family 2 protein [Planctomycetota bacterium]